MPDPAETEQRGGLCPVCGKKLTIGVEHRVEVLADRPAGFRPEGAKPFESLAPLPEVIAASTGGSAAGKKTLEQYERLLQTLGPEFTILRDVPIEDLQREAGPCVAEGIRRLRLGQVERRPGFDGEYGAISSCPGGDPAPERDRSPCLGQRRPQNRGRKSGDSSQSGRRRRSGRGSRASSAPIPSSRRPSRRRSEP